MKDGECKTKYWEDYIRQRERFTYWGGSQLNYKDEKYYGKDRIGNKDKKTSETKESLEGKKGLKKKKWLETQRQLEGEESNVPVGIRNKI